MDKSISKNLQRFIQLYAVNNSVSRSAEEVGLSREYCSRALRRNNVQALLEHERAKVAQKYDVTQRDIVENLKMLANPANIEAKLTSPSAARAANRDLGELLGMWKDEPEQVKHQHSGDIHVRIERRKREH